MARTRTRRRRRQLFKHGSDRSVLLTQAEGYDRDAKKELAQARSFRAAGDAEAAADCERRAAELQADAERLREKRRKLYPLLSMVTA